MAPTKLQRQLDLIAYLVGRRVPLRVEDLMEKIPGYSDNWRRGDEKGMNTARRMFERDKDELRRSGIPLRTVPCTIDGEEMDGYAIARRDFYLPYLRLVTGTSGRAGEYADGQRIASSELSPDDAPLALEALRRVIDLPSFPLADEAASAFRKVAFDLDPRVFANTPPVLFVDQPGTGELTEHLQLLTDALFARKRVRFRYHGIYRDEETERTVEAYALLYHAGYWYLVGFDHMRADRRVFRVGRMEDIQPNTAAPNTPDYTIPKDFSIEDYTGRRAWELGEPEEAPVEARVLFHFPQSLWAERNAFGRLYETRADGSAVRTFEVLQVSPFLRWVLSQEGDAEIVSPPEMQEQVRVLARAVATAHGGAGHASQ